MIFLKKIEAKGFKSYANNVVLDFNEPMVGVVGPNGAGKSNVIDAIKWVLGEKSHKALRGKKSDDVIFHGSQNMSESEYAEVTLTFNNVNKVLYSDLNEIAVTRKLYRGSGNNEYYINGKEARLRDIQDIFLDTGLSKGSLCIISQGTVNWFADAKPEERRKIFEDAAGIGRYTKMKQESLRQLERANTNFNRVSDLVKELGRDLKKLEAQAEKLEKFKEYKNELTNLELKILVKDIIENRQILEEISKKLSTSEQDKSSTSPQLAVLEREKSMYNEMINEADKVIFETNNAVNAINEKIMALEIKKSVFENDIKSKIDSNNKEEKIEALKTSIQNLTTEIKHKTSMLEINGTELKETEEQYSQASALKDKLQEEFLELNKNISANRVLLNTFKDSLENNSNIPAGAKTIIENKDAITGIHGLVSQCISMEDKYEKAIYTALGGNINNVIVNTNNDAKIAIEFLKRNKAGSATFMPVYDLKPKYINDEYLNVASEIEGYVDVASNLVKYEKKIFKSVVDILLAKTIVATDIHKAIDISKYTNQSFKVVTLDGDVVNPGGILKGGFNKSGDSVFNLEKKIETLEKMCNEEQERIGEIKLELEGNIINLQELQSSISEKKNNISRYEEQIKEHEKDLAFYKSEFEKIASSSPESVSGTQDVSSYTYSIHELNSANIERESLYEKLKVNQEKKENLKGKLAVTEQQITQARKLLDESSDIIIKYNVEQAKCQAILDYSKERINVNYKMTVESAVLNYNQSLEMPEDKARDRIRLLTKNIEYLGDLNMEAGKELDEKKGRMESLQKELVEATEARDKIFEVISKSDEKAISDFRNVVDKINKELPEIFKYLFGGGSCRIEFTDESDLLETGIDILASPPGKKINSLVALSGGEKTLVALSVLFSILRTSSFPLVILDEAEAALDPSNVERFGNIISAFSNETQFLVITHRPGTMERCDSLYGATMETKGVTSMYRIELREAQKIAEND